jgi:2-polyprenyl-3-methyl-5-hydroxy-6-metoxy-1,4-benzoquinol methylase
MSHHQEIARGARFGFGANWSRFLRHVDERRIADAEASVRRLLGDSELTGRRFLDIGSGSGLFSLAAHRMGAAVTSFDYDPLSAECTRTLRDRYRERPDWEVLEGSVLDDAFMASLGTFDVVYSWGVLHHTGDMRSALEHAGAAVAPGGRLVVAIYNDQRGVSRYWTAVKRTYNRVPAARPLIVAAHAPYLVGVRWLVRALTGRRTLERGMTLWYDMLDWLGGYPFEVARPEWVFQLFRQRGFILRDLMTCGGRMGCNEFVFDLPRGAIAGDGGGSTERGRATMEAAER